MSDSSDKQLTAGDWAPAATYLTCTPRYCAVCRKCHCPY